MWTNVRISVAGPSYIRVLLTNPAFCRLLNYKYFVVTRGCVCFFVCRVIECRSGAAMYLWNWIYWFSVYTFHGRGIFCGCKCVRPWLLACWVVVYWCRDVPMEVTIMWCWSVGFLSVYIFYGSGTVCELQKHCGNKSTVYRTKLCTERPTVYRKTLGHFVKSWSKLSSETPW